MRILATGFASRRSLLRATGIILLILSLLIFLAPGGNTAGARSVMWIFAILCFFGGLLLAFLPAQYAAIVNWLMKFSDQTIRVLSGIGLAIGVLILFLGIAYY